MNPPTIVPAVLTTSKDEVLRKAKIAELYSSRFHIDIEDGLFVPEKTVNLNFMEYLSTKAKVELHLMVRNPLEIISQLALYKHKPSLVIFHREACRTQAEAEYLIKHLHALHIDACIALSPETAVKEIYSCAKHADEILVMTVHPGKKGQEFIPVELSKIKTLRQLFPEKNIAVDGGINPETARLAINAGANVLVANSAVFDKKDIGEAIDELRSGTKNKITAHLSDTDQVK